MKVPSYLWNSIVVLCAALASGCAATAPRYAPQIGTTLELRAAGFDKVSIGKVVKDAGVKKDVNKLRARAVTVSSPYGSYTEYFREALMAEFDHAELLDAAAPLRIDGVLTHNVLGGNMDREYAEIGATLTVTRGGQVVYNAAKTARHDWESSFLGAVAIPRAIENYRVGVQRLIAAFIADPQFAAALKKR